MLVDNGPTVQLGRETFQQFIKMHRCAACFNTCPVYRRSGGFSYHAVIAGPIGSILAPNLDMKQYADLLLRLRFVAAAPMFVRLKCIHNQLYQWRQVITAEGHSPKAKSVVMKAMAFTLSKPALFNFAGKAARLVIKYLPFMVNNRLNPWYKQRDLPSAPKQSFTEWYKKNRNEQQDKILQAVKANQPALQPLPDLNATANNQVRDTFDQFVSVLKSIGGNVVEIKHTDEIYQYVKNNFSSCQNFVTTLPQINQLAMLDQNTDPHLLENIEVAVIGAQFGVAENGAVG